MAGGVNVKMGVSGVAQFKKNIGDAKQAVKTLDAQLQLTEKEFNATGDAEAYMAKKTAELEAKLEAQKTVVDTAEKALKAMADNGVDKASTAYQNLYRQMLDAKGEMIDTETQLQNVGSAAGEAAGSADKVGEGLKSVGKGVAWENVTDGIGKITEKLESAARAAINLGKKIAQSAMDSTGWADEILREAQKYGTDAKTIQQMRNVAEFIETDLDTIMTAKSRLAKNKGSLGDLLGIDVNGKSVDEAFWAAGEAIMGMTDEFEKEEAAQKVFGRGWKELIPLFEAGQEGYNEALENTNVLTNEQVAKLGEADDAIKKVQQQLELMKNQFWAENADKIVELAQWLVDNKDGLVTALTGIAAGFAALKLGEVALNIGKVVNGFKTLWGGANNPLPNVGGAETGGATGGATGGTGGGLASKAASFLGSSGGFATASAAIVFAFGQAMEKLTYQNQWGQFNANEAAQAGQDVPELLRLIHDAAVGVDDGEYGDRMELAKQLFLEHGNEFYQSNPDLQFWRNGALAGFLEDGQLTNEELSSIIENDLVPVADDWEELMRELYNIYSENTDDLTGAGAGSVKDAGDKMQDAAEKLEGMPEEVAKAVQKVGFTFTLEGQPLVAYVSSQLAADLANRRYVP